MPGDRPDQPPSAAGRARPPAARPAVSEVAPISFADLLAARARISPYLGGTPLRRYAPLDELVGHGLQVLVKHENHLPTNAFKARNAMSLMTTLSEEERRRGVVAATRGNHGAGLAWAGSLLGVPVTICVPRGNNPEKNAAIRGYGAELLELGEDYDETAAHTARLVEERGLVLAHSTNDARIMAGAGTLGLELFEQAPDLDAVVVAIGGGSQAVGVIVAAQELAPRARVYGVQAAGAPAIHDSWHRGERLTTASAITIADGLATRATYDTSFATLRAGLAGFVLVEESEIVEAIRILLSTTHNLVEGAGAAGLAGLRKLAPELAGQRVAIVLSGGNLDAATLRQVVTG